MKLHFLAFLDRKYSKMQHRRHSFIIKKEKLLKKKHIHDLLLELRFYICNILNLKILYHE